MGAFDDVESRSPTRSMLGRGMGEARRRIVLLIFLAFFLILTIVAFRRQDDIKEVVNNRLKSNTNTASTLAAEKGIKKPEVTAAANTAETQPSTKPDATISSVAATKTTAKADSKKGKSSSNANTQTGKGPKLGNGDRVVPPSNIADIHNSTLGVCGMQKIDSRGALADMANLYSSRISLSSMFRLEATSSMR